MFFSKKKEVEKQYVLHFLKMKGLKLLQITLLQLLPT